MPFIMFENENIEQGYYWVKNSNPKSQAFRSHVVTNGWTGQEGSSAEDGIMGMGHSGKQYNLLCRVHATVCGLHLEIHIAQKTRTEAFSVNLVLHIVQTLWCILCKGRCILCARAVAGHTQMGASHALRGSSRGHWLVCRWHSTGRTLWCWRQQT